MNTVDLKEKKLLIELGVSKDDLEGKLDDLVSKLETIVHGWNDSYEQGFEPVSNDVYDAVRGIIKKLDPESSVFQSTYSKDYEELDEDHDKYLIEFPMKSIETIKNINELKKFKAIVKEYQENTGEQLEVVVSAKLNGHGIRTVLNEQGIVSASTRGRYKRGRNITEHLKVILDNNSVQKLTEYGLVELRGEILLAKNNLHIARQFNTDIKSVFTAVSSLIRPYANTDELELLDFIPYNIFTETLEFDNITDKYEFLTEMGFDVPVYCVCTLDYDNFENDIKEILEVMKDELANYKYDTDGIVVSVNNIEYLRSLGESETSLNGNVALKMGEWEQRAYSAKILEVVLTQGKKKKTPKALIEPTKTKNGNTVSRVPLYNLATMELLGAYPGELIWFKYGGESGVIPCHPDGTPVSALENAIEIMDDYDEDFDNFGTTFEELGI